MNWRLGFPSLVSLEHVLESIEQIATIVWSGGSLWVILHAECRYFAMPYAGDGVIVQVAVSDFQASGHGGFFDGEAMILGSDFYATGLVVQHGLVCASVTEFKLKGLRSTGERE